MKVLMIYNGWQKIEDVPENIVRSGIICFYVTPPLILKPTVTDSTDKFTAICCCVYDMGKKTSDGHPIFENEPGIPEFIPKAEGKDDSRRDQRDK